MQIHPPVSPPHRSTFPNCANDQLTPTERQRFSRVLLVEDDQDQLATLADMLAHDGFEVIACATGAEALAFACEQEFGVAILDLQLPDMDGTVVLEKLHELNSSTRVIIHTGYGTFDAARTAVNRGAFAFVEKLCDPEELLRQVHRAIAEQVSRYAADLEAAVERRTAALRDSESRLRAIIESSPDALIVTDEQGRIDTFSPTAERLFGCTAAQAVGRPILEFIGTQPALPPAHFLDRLWRSAPSAFYNLAGEVYGRRADGSTFPIDVDLGEVRLHGHRHIAGFVRDLTERKRQEDQLRQAQKMEAIGRLAGGIAHDFNNLLTVIGGYGELLLARSRGADDRDMAEQIQQAVQRGAALTRQLLAFSRQQPMMPQVLDMNAVVAAAQRLLQRLIGADVELVTELAPELPPIRADMNQLEQVLLNLAVNARDALPQGGRLAIRTAVAPEGDVVLDVEDNGIGMDDTTRSHLFEPFFTTKGPGKGTGLGLATVYAIVQRFQGRIDVTSSPGRGARFRLRFPKATEPLVPEAHEARLPPPPVGRETILLVEDEAPLRGLLHRFLESEGYQVLTAPTGKEGLEVLLQRGDDVQLLVTDLTMPKMGGRELAIHARKHYPNLKILYISGYNAAGATLQESLGAGESYLQKPFPLPQLHRSMRDLLDGHAANA